MVNTALLATLRQEIAAQGKLCDNTCVQLSSDMI